MDKELYSKLVEKLESYRDYAIKMQEEMIPMKPLSPENGGDGELEKAKYLENIVRPLVDDLQYYNAEDRRTSSGVRPNIMAIKKGKDSSRRFLVLGHMDVVPSGDEKIWDFDPWKATIKDGKIYGRGSEDNNQAIISVVCLLKALKDENIVPPIDLVLLLASDEECGNKYGIKYLTKNHREIFKKGDKAIAPDSGKKEGDEISIAEKGTVWFKVITKGKQAHGAYPNKGINAHYAAAEFITRVERLKKKYNEENPIFIPPYTTIEVTKKEQNVPNVNTIPDIDITYFDCRLLPGVSREELIKDFENIKNDVEAARNVEITFEYPYLSVSNETLIDSPISKATIAAVKDVYGVDPKLVGIGGGTIAAYLRYIGIDSVVYSKLDDTLHEPNEYCVIDNMIGDAKIMAHMLSSF